MVQDPGVEVDKPFVLTLIGTLALIGVGAYGVVTGRWDLAKQFIETISPLVSMAWGFYFRHKS